MDERLKFIARLLDGEKMAVLCRQFGISRKTGYSMGMDARGRAARVDCRHWGARPVRVETSKAACQDLINALAPRHRTSL